MLALLSQDQQNQLKGICGRAFYSSLQHSVLVEGSPPSRVVVATGDIPDEYLRDSAVQLAIYLPRLNTHPVLKPVRHMWYNAGMSV